MSSLYSLLLVTLVVTVADGHSIQKRSISFFGSMIKTMTGRSSLDFNDYGKWCGFGGSGEPVDGIDRCCQQHDFCYDKANGNQCKSLLKAYSTKYKWTYHNGVILCHDDRACAQTTCLCDSTAAKCFKDHLEEYDSSKQSFWGKIIHKIVGR